MVICLEQGANDLHMVQLMPLPLHIEYLHAETSYRPAAAIMLIVLIANKRLSGR